MIEYHDPMNTPEGMVLKAVHDLEKAVIRKYQQEPSVDNGVPTFMDHAGGVPVQATSAYTTNQNIPDMNDGPKPSPISETYSMPSVYKTSYDVNGSSLHLQMVDGGGKTDNLDSVEDAMTALKVIKASGSVGQFGIIDEIADLMEQVITRL